MRRADDDIEGASIILMLADTGCRDLSEWRESSLLTTPKPDGGEVKAPTMTRDEAIEMINVDPRPGVYQRRLGTALPLLSLPACRAWPAGSEARPDQKPEYSAAARRPAFHGLTAARSNGNSVSGLPPWQRSLMFAWTFAYQHLCIDLGTNGTTRSEHA
jgi:hypothetical protein